MHALISGLRSYNTTTLGIATVLSIAAGAAMQLLDGDLTTNPDWNVVIPGICSGIGLILCRDAEKRSESVGAV